MQDDSSGTSDGDLEGGRAPGLESDRGSRRSAAVIPSSELLGRAPADAPLGPLVMLEVAKQPKTNSPWMLDQDWVQPPPGPADGGEGSAQPRYTLTAGRPYRIALARPASGDRSVRKWVGVRLHVRVTFADDGATVKPDALLAFPPGSRSALTSWEVSLRMNRHGFTDEVFGIAASNADHGGRPFSVQVYLATGGILASSFGVHVADGRARAALAKRARAGPDSPPASARRRSRPDVDASSDGSSESPVSPLAWGPRELATPEGPPRPAGPPVLDELTRDFEGLCRFGTDAAAEGDDPPAPLAVLEADADDDFGSGVASSSGAPCGGGDGLAACYRQADHAEMQLALGAVETAAAAVAAAAKAAGVRHPVPASAPPPRAVVLACADLASALSSPGLFGTPLFATRDGRYRLRRMVEDLRLSGSSDLVDAVHNCWRDALLSGPPSAHSAPGEAEALAGHVWDALEVITGPPHSMRAVDLVPVDREFVFALLDRADQLLKWTGAASAKLQVKALTRRGWMLGQYGDADAALDLYFAGWSLLIRECPGPSRTEAHLLCELVDLILARLPAKFDLAEHLCTKVYWFTTGSDEDRYLEALAARTLGMQAMSRGRWRNTKQHLTRAAAILDSMSEGYRSYAERIHKNIGHCSFHTGDLRGILRSVRRVFALVGALGFSFQELDVWAQSFTSARAMAEAHYRPPRMSGRVYTMSDFAKTLGWLLTLELKFASASNPTHGLVTVHHTYQVGLASACCGEWAKALACFEKARAFYARYPAYFPPRLPRCRNVADGIALCRARLAPGPAGDPLDAPVTGPRADDPFEAHRGAPAGDGFLPPPLPLPRPPALPQPPPAAPCAAPAPSLLPRRHSQPRRPPPSWASPAPSC